MKRGADRARKALPVCVGATFVPELIVASHTKKGFSIWQSDDMVQRVGLRGAGESD